MPVEAKNNLLDADILENNSLLPGGDTHAISPLSPLAGAVSFARTINTAARKDPDLLQVLQDHGTVIASIILGSASHLGHSEEDLAVVEELLRPNMGDEEVTVEEAFDLDSQLPPVPKEITIPNLKQWFRDCHKML